MASLHFWNEFELKKPPLVTLHVNDTGFAKNVFVVTNRYLNQLSGPDYLEFNQTAALIGRLMARRKNSFRCMPGFRAVCKLNAALCRLLRLDLPRELEHFRGALPDACDEELSGEMPTRNSLEFILVRLIAFHRLHERIRDCCEATVKYFGQMIRSNFFMEFLTLLIAAVAKINKLSLLQANNCATLYNKLQPQLTKFPLVEKHKFIPENCNLPTQLRLIKAGQPLVPAEEAPSASVKLQTQLPPLVTKVEKAKERAKADVGTVVARKSPKAASTQPTFQLDSLATVEDVKHFIVRESKARKKTPDSCVTKAIQNHEWLAATTLFERKLQAREQKKALNVFRKYIDSKI
ncbi:uncharacterized protein [Drosophila virilis]|uniref:Nucleolus and neural progenitor protein-like N-terminal domain-containing protein n=1 Tax=Drosophila virilis TaxID=7244 RepID=B4LGI0_DROVI|nr:uncharacterized protein LOC6624583 [Drosophila virilis]EDW69418.1 uncharacterized protein Dvir_GJ12123 [Drosophila virilis]